MYVGALKAEFRLYGVKSLKEKRSPVRSFKDRFSRKFSCAVAEVDCQDKWQRVVLAVAVVGGEEKQLRHHLSTIRREMEKERELQFISAEEFVYDSGSSLSSDEWGTPPDLLFSDL